MSVTKKILAVIPARGGSKGIPRKNVIDVCGQPLIAYSIEQGKKLLQENIINELIVSTDNEEIAEVSGKFGARVPFLRPEAISADNSKTIDVIQHALHWFSVNEDKQFDAVLLLQPTSPLRSVEETKRAISIFNGGTSQSLISVYKEEYINDLVMYKFKDVSGNQGYPLNANHNKGVRRQDHGFVYVRNGSIYISSVELLNKGLIISDEPLLFEMDKARSINVDTMEDLKLLESFLCK